MVVKRIREVSRKMPQTIQVQEFLGPSCPETSLGEGQKKIPPNNWEEAHFIVRPQLGYLHFWSRKLIRLQMKDAEKCLLDMTHGMDFDRDLFRFGRIQTG